jgi:hypothetical protein
MRQQMPKTAEWIDARRAEWGIDHVNGCLRKALAGQAGWFYAMERGHVLGTPFPATSEVHADQQLAVALGCAFAAFMARPGRAHGQD